MIKFIDNPSNITKGYQVTTEEGSIFHMLFSKLGDAVVVDDKTDETTYVCDMGDYLIAGYSNLVEEQIELTGFGANPEPGSKIAVRFTEKENTEEDAEIIRETIKTIIEVANVSTSEIEEWFEETNESAE